MGNRMFSTVITVGTELLEQQYLHVNHADAFKLFERARIEYMAAIGFPQESMLARDYFAVIVEVSARYKREILGGKYTVTCEDPAVHRKLFTVHQRILNESGEPCVEALVKFLFMCGSTRRAISAPAEFIEAYTGFKG